MTVEAPPRRELVTDALVAMLRASLPSWRIGDNQPPPGFEDRDLTGTDFPYAILYTLDGGNRYLDFDGNGSIELPYQVSVYGWKLRNAGERAADLMAEAIVTGALTDPAGISVYYRELDPPAGTTREGIKGGFTWFTPVRFRVYVCRSS